MPQHLGELPEEGRILHSRAHIISYRCRDLRARSFGADLVLMPYLIAKWGNGSFAVREILDAPAKRPENDYTVFLIIQKF
jgi:hypothetical protein